MRELPSCPSTTNTKWLLHNREVWSLWGLTSRDFVLWFGRYGKTMQLCVGLNIVNQEISCKKLVGGVFSVFLCDTFTHCKGHVVWICYKDLTIGRRSMMGRYTLMGITRKNKIKHFEKHNVGHNMFFKIPTCMEEKMTSYKMPLNYTTKILCFM